MNKKQRGFTLLEIAVVLVIIGLLLGGIMQGQSLIKSAKVKSIVSDLEGTAAAIYAYQDRYKALPGDNTQAALQHGGAPCAGGQCDNGILDGAWDSAAGSGEETSLVWQHLRSAGFVAGSGDLQPKHALGGTMGIAGAQVLNGIQNVNRLVLGNITGEYAAMIDRELDDGLADGGMLLGSDKAVDAAAAYVLADNYPVLSWRY